MIINFERNQRILLSNFSGKRFHCLKKIMSISHSSGVDAKDMATWEGL